MRAVLAILLALASSAYASTIYVVGDTGSGNSAQLRVRDRMLATGMPDALIHTGDMIYDSGSASDQNPKFFTPYAAFFNAGKSFYPCLGNHDAKNKSVWLDVHDPSVHPLSPTTNPGQAYYGVDIAGGLVHLTMLDSNAGSSATQKSWARADMCGSTAPWVLVAFHHTSYSNSHHGSSSTMRGWDSVFRECGVDLVLMGHDHDYERTKPQAGVVYITTGGGGQSLYDNGSSSFTAFSASAYHFTRLQVGTTDLCIDAIADTGAILDHSCITKGSTPTTTTPPTTTPTTVPPTTTLPPPAVVNGGFESGQTGWAGWGDNNNKGEARVDTTGPCEGASSLHMFDSSTYTRQVRQDIAARSGSLHFVARTKQLGSNQGFMRWEWRTSSALISTAQVTLPPGTSGCTAYTTPLTSPAGATVLRLMPTLGPKTNGQPSNDAEAWWDRVEVTP